MDKTVKISPDFWETSESLCLLNPKIPLKEKQIIEKAVNQYEGESQVWLKSSGTELSLHGIKILCLSKDKILKAAESVNKFYEITSKDLWLNPLPLFHIGGLSVKARCFLAKAGELEFKTWQVQGFYKTLCETKASLTSLVPTQVFDLVNKKLKCPSSLRLALVGGGFLDVELYKKARFLNWPLALSYGMTETSALIAGANPNDLRKNTPPKMELLPHVKLHEWGSHFIIDSPSLFDFYLWVSFHSPPVLEKRPNPFILDDRLKVSSRHLRVLARSTELVKILGETVNLVDLARKIGEKVKQNCVVISQPHPRRGSKLCLFVESGQNSWNLEQINKDLMPFEEIQIVRSVASFPRGVTGKILKSDLVGSLQWSDCV